jgi:hypothetical protein
MNAGRGVGEGVGEHRRALADVVAGDPVAEVDHPRLGRNPVDHGVADADELVIASIVGEEGDQRPLHRREI